MSLDAQIAAQLSELLGRKALFLQEMVEWLTGTADGGPNGDGRYPITIGGVPTLLPCPAKSLSGGLLTAEGVAQLDQAAPADVGPGTLVLGVALDGKPKRFAPELIAARPLTALQELMQGEYAEWISCLSSTGQERRIAIEHLQSAVGNVIDPTHPPYNVVYDFQKQKGTQFDAGSNAMRSPYNACFRQSDIGKLLVASNGGQDGALEGYIGKIEDNGSTARIFTDLTFTTPKNAYYGQGFSEFIWGTDCTAGMQRALDDAEPRSFDMPGKVVVLGGIALVRRLRFGSIAIVGLSPMSCGFAALPSPNDGSPFIRDKDYDQYAGQLKPQYYTLKGLTIFGQFYTQCYSSFRRGLEIRGGGFYAFSTGAPYGRIEDLDIRQAQWDGALFDGAFGGQFNSVRLFNNNYCGMRMGFYDLNGQNWHAEGNRHTGIYSTMVGGNVATVRTSFNGVGGAGDGNPHEHGANYVEAGAGNTVTNLRAQESWGHNLIFSDVDTINARPGLGNKNKFIMGTFDDTGSITAVDGQYSDDRLPDVRAMVYVRRTSSDPQKGPHNNEVELVSGSPQVRGVNYATNAYGDEGSPEGGFVVLRTPGITNDVSQWYSGPGNKVAYSPGPWMTKSPTSIASRANQVNVNGQLAA